MKALAKFRERIREAPPQSGLWAYRMDEEGEGGGMAAAADLLLCDCCDYFRPVDGAPVLMEMTALAKWKAAKEKQFAALGAAAGGFVWQLAKRENRLKLYGGLLVLCRHARRSAEVANGLDEGKCEFWLVVTDARGPQVGKIFRHLRAELRQELRHGPRRKKILAEVEVFGVDRLPDKLPPD